MPRATPMWSGSPANSRATVGLCELTLELHDSLAQPWCMERGCGRNRCSGDGGGIAGRTRREPQSYARATRTHAGTHRGYQHRAMVSPQKHKRGPSLLPCGGLQAHTRGDSRCGCIAWQRAGVRADAWPCSFAKRLPARLPQSSPRSAARRHAIDRRDRRGVAQRKWHAPAA